MSALPPTNDDSAIWDIWQAQFRLPVVNVNAEVGTFKALGDAALTADELAAQLGVDARALVMHLAALCSMGLVEKRLGKWRATHLARTWLHPDGAGYWGHFTRQIDFNETLRTRLLESLRTGKRPGQSGSGDITSRPVEWERGTMSQEAAERIAIFMHAHSQAPALGAAAQGIFGELNSLMDDDCTGPFPGAAFSLLMLVGTLGKQYTLAEFRDILGSAGFVDIEAVRTGGGYYSLVSARKP